MNIADWYERVNETWPKEINTHAPLTADEAVRAARKLYRFGMRRTFRGPVRVTSGNRYTWIYGGELRVNAEKGWHDLVHNISHYCHSRRYPGERPHSRRHAQTEIRMIKQALKRGWIGGALKSQPKPPKPPPDKLARLREREKRWTTRARRAATALKKIARQIRRLERVAA